MKHFGLLIGVLFLSSNLMANSLHDLIASRNLKELQVALLGDNVRELLRERNADGRTPFMVALEVEKTHPDEAFAMIEALAKDRTDEELRVWQLTVAPIRHVPKTSKGPISGAFVSSLFAVTITTPFFARVHKYITEKRKALQEAQRALAHILELVASTPPPIPPPTILLPPPTPTSTVTEEDYDKPTLIIPPGQNYFEVDPPEI